MRRHRPNVVADFETSANWGADGELPDETWVWLWSVRGVEDRSIDVIGYDMDSFMDYLFHHRMVFYFHNLKFDGSFIIYWLLAHGWRHTELSEDISRGFFSTVISDTGQFYAIEIAAPCGRVTIYDSLKKIPLPVRVIPKAYGLESSKGDIDHTIIRPRGYSPTDEEIDYVRRDTGIVADALRQDFENGNTRITASSDALAYLEFTLGGRDAFRELFPLLPNEVDESIRRAYRGGFTYADPRFAGRVVGPGSVFDVNSLYPFVMHERPLPYGEPRAVRSMPTDDSLFIMTVKFTARLKDRAIPCIQLKGSHWAHPTEYQPVIEEPTEMRVTNVDWNLITTMYDVDVIRKCDFLVFDSQVGMFNKHIDHFMEVKANSSGGKRQNAKLKLNSPYGKFASRTERVNKVPHLSTKDGAVHYRNTEAHTVEPIYTALGVFITAWARDYTLRSALANYDRFLYADTDSLHILGTEPPSGLRVHNSDLGAWKHEGDFDSGIFIRAKQYCEEKDGEPSTHIAGLPLKLSTEVVPRDLETEQEWYGKLVPMSVKGGNVLVPSKFKFTPIERGRNVEEHEDGVGDSARVGG